MALFLLAALPALIELVPQLGKLFSSDSPTAQRNVAAAAAVAQVAKGAVILAQIVYFLFIVTVKKSGR